MYSTLINSLINGKNALFVSLGLLSSQSPLTIIGPALPTPVTKENTVFAVDFHGVVSKSAKKEILSYSGKILTNPKALMLMAKIAVHPKVLMGIIKKTHVAEEIFNLLAQEYPELQNFEQDFINLTNLQNPQQPVLDIVKNLKDNGYTVVLASNIGPKTYADLEKKQPEVLGLFTTKFIAEAPNYLHKPQPAYFEKIKNSFSTKNIVLIDDSKKHLIAAANNGITGIHFTKPEALATTLSTIGVFDTAGAVVQ